MTLTAPPPAPTPDRPRDELSDAERQLLADSAWARLGSFAFRRRRSVLEAWILVLAGVFTVVGTVGSSTDSSFESPDSDSQIGFEILEENFGGSGSFLSGTVVFQAEQGVDDPFVVGVMSGVFDFVDEFEEVTLTSPYTAEGQAQGLIAPDGTIAYARIDIAEGTDEIRASEIGSEIVELVEGIESTGVEGLRIEIGGAALAEFEPPESELIGIAFAIVILILSFGSVLAMGLPIGVALFGVGIGVGITPMLTHVM